MTVSLNVQLRVMSNIIFLLFVYSLLRLTAEAFSATCVKVSCVYLPIVCLDNAASPLVCLFLFRMVSTCLNSPFVQLQIAKDCCQIMLIFPLRGPPWSAKDSLGPARMLCYRNHPWSTGKPKKKFQALSTRWFFSLSFLLHGPPSLLCVCQLVSSPGMPSLAVPIDSSALRAMKQSDHLTKALLLFMFLKCLAPFTKLPSTVCLESLINLFCLCSYPPPLYELYNPSFFIYAYFGVYVKVHNVCPALLSLQLFCLHLLTAPSTS